MTRDTAGEERTKRQRMFLRAAGVLFAGVSYAAFVSVTGRGFPCLFRLATGLKCPGCGITTCLLALMKLDLYTAFHANPLVVSLLPATALYGGYRAVCCLTGRKGTSMTETVALTVTLMITIVFGVVRNLPPEWIHRFL